MLDKYFTQYNKTRDIFLFTVHDERERNRIVTEYKHRFKHGAYYYDLYVYKVVGNTVQMKKW